MVLTKRYWVLIGLTVALLGGTLLYFGWTKQKSEPAKSQPEQPKPEVIRQIMIPSSLDPDDVMAQFVPYIPAWGEVITEDHIFWATELPITSPHRGFVKGFSTSWHGVVWTKKDGTKVEPPQDPYGFILNLAVLKYEKPESAKEDYDRISIKQEFKESTLKSVKFKSKPGIPLAAWNWFKEQNAKLEQDQCQQYLLHSNNFIIYGYGLNEVIKDVMIRIIDRYAVE